MVQRTMLRRYLNITSTKNKCNRAIDQWRYTVSKAVVPIRWVPTPKLVEEE